MQWLINKSNVREYALRCSKENRNGKFKRVASDYYLGINDAVAKAITNSVNSQPSVGKTITFK